MANLQKTTTSSFPFLSILALIFITLKLIGTISWSWWWVLAPLWAPAGIVMTIALLFFIVGGLIKAIVR